MPGPTLDRTLQSNIATGMLLPRLDQAVGHGLKYLVQQLGATASDVLRVFGLRQPQADPLPSVHLQPGNAVSMTAPAVGPNVHVKTAVCAETGKQLPLLPRELCDEYKSYADPISAAGSPAKVMMPERFNDAFTQKVKLADGNEVDLLPPSLMNSSLLNYKLHSQLQTELPKSIDDVKLEIEEQKRDIPTAKDNVAYTKEVIENVEKQLKKIFRGTPEHTKKLEELNGLRDSLREDKNKLENLQKGLTESEATLEKFQNALKTVNEGASFRGKPQTISPNTLFDPLTGFAASIMVRDNREVVVSFSGMGGQGAGPGHAVRCFLNILGFTTPKNFSQASQLTQMVRKQINDLNSNLPPGAAPFTLKLAGHSMGGGMATYAALRNKEEAVVFNPLRLGLLTRAKVGRPALKNAKNHVTEVVVQTDWVSDNWASKFYKVLNLPSLMLTGRKADTRGAIGHRFLVPLPTFEQVNKDPNVKIKEGKDREASIREYLREFTPHDRFAEAIDFHSASEQIEQPSVEAEVLPRFGGAHP